MDRLKRLFNRRANNDKDPPLHQAVREGNLRKVKKLLEKGENPNLPDKHHLMPLHYAAYWGENEIATLLLKYGAKADTDNGLGWTPLHAAAFSGGLKTRKNMIDILTAAGGDLHKPDKRGCAPKDYMLLWAPDEKAEKAVTDYLKVANKTGAAYTPPKRPAYTRTPKH